MFLHFQLVMHFSSPCRSCLMERESASMDEVGNNYCLPFTCRVSGSTLLLSVCKTREQHDSAGNTVTSLAANTHKIHSSSPLTLTLTLTFCFMSSSRVGATINYLKGQIFISFLCLMLCSYSIMSICVLYPPCLVMHFQKLENIHNWPIGKLDVQRSDSMLLQVHQYAPCMCIKALSCFVWSVSHQSFAQSKTIRSLSFSHDFYITFMNVFCKHTNS